MTVMAASMRKYFFAVCSKRFYCSEANTHNVRVRFAPSPTGFMHLGGLRTALYNYLFAKSNNGCFIVRIENTDQTRTIPGAARQIEEGLVWAGLTPDEGPLSGGNYGPYTQSERLDLYQEEIKHLLQNGAAYHCFCSSKRLELLRKDAARRQETPKYDNKCRHLTKTEVAEKLARNHEYVVRLKMDSEEQFDDMIKGTILHNVSAIEGDAILIKSDKYPTYHFANVVDDHHMNITHVFRGEEWLLSTPKHVMIYKAMGWTPPKFAHLPLILNRNGTKLSKRQNDITVSHFKDNGYFPEAVINYITKVGGGFGTDEVFGWSLQKLINTFSLERVRKTSGRLDSLWLEESNKIHLTEKLGSEQRAEIISYTKTLLQEKLINSNKEETNLADDYIGSILDWSIIEGRLSNIHQLLEPELAFLWVAPPEDVIKEIVPISDNIKCVIKNCVTKLNSVKDFTKECIAKVLQCHIREEEITMKNYMKAMRLAMSGKKNGPPVAEMMYLIGQQNTINRLQQVVNRIKT